MEGKDIEKQARIKVSRIIKSVAHVCYCNTPAFDAFEGEVTDISIQWPIVNGRYRMSYCPWCGLHLPMQIKEKGGSSI